MKQLNLEDFKSKMNADDNQEMDSLLGGILGDCHEKPPCKPCGPHLYAPCCLED